MYLFGTHSSGGMYYMVVLSKLTKLATTITMTIDIQSIVSYEFIPEYNN